MIEYSKHKGLDEKKCEALLLDSLKDHGSLTKTETVHLLWNVLPDQLDDKQKEYKIIATSTYMGHGRIPPG